MGDTAKLNVRNGLDVLVVEDEALVAMDLEFMLEEAGHVAVANADDFQSALAAMERCDPDLALVDIQLAFGDSGLKVAESLHERGIPVLFATGNCPGEAGRPFALGCIHKPIVDRTLRAALAAAKAKLEGGEVPPLPPAVHFY